MRLALTLAAACVAALPASAQSPAIWLGMECDGPMPRGVLIVALKRGTVTLTLEEMLAFCAAHAPAPAEPQQQTWRGTT